MARERGLPSNSLVPSVWSVTICAMAVTAFTSPVVAHPIGSVAGLPPQGCWMPNQGSPGPGLCRSIRGSFVGP